MKKLLFLVIVTGLTLGALLGCPCPDCPKPGGGIISGRVYDCITGDGIDGATVVFGAYSATTNIWGAYRITVPDSVYTVEGVYAAFKGLDYSFGLCGAISLDPTVNPVFDVWLYPYNTAGYINRNLSGRIYDDTGAEIGDGNVQFQVFNEHGGRWLCETSYVQGVGYTASTKSFGYHCFVEVEVEDQFQFYLKDQDLSADLSNYDLAQPDTGFTSVDLLNGTPGSDVDGYLLVPGYGWAGIAGGSPPQTTLDIYNPDNYSMCWQTQMQVDPPGPGLETFWLNSRTMPFSGTITLPAPYSHAAPSATVDGATASWDGSTLSFGATADANGYLVVLGDDTGHSGGIIMNSSSITIPDEFVNAILDPGQGWDIMVWPLWSPHCSTDAILDFVLSFPTQEGDDFLPRGDFQGAFSLDWDVKKADIIP